MGQRRKPPGSGFDRIAYDRAAKDQQLERRLSKRPVPARITLALDYRGLFGDQVDRDLGVWEPPDGWAGPGWEPGTAVDRWEAGTLIPTRRQVLALANLTQLPWQFFYTRVENLPNRIFVCDRRSGHGLTIVQNSVDADGVLHSFYEKDEVDREEEPVVPVPTRTTANTRRGKKLMVPVETHRFNRDYYDPLACRVCGLPERNRRHDGEQGDSGDGEGS